MERILQILRRFGGATLLNALPSKSDFEERLQKNTLIADDLEARLKAIDVDIGVSSRKKYSGSGLDNKYN